MSTPTILRSRLDASVNHVVAAGDGGFFESRYVRRVPERWICYLSSHSGCAKACRFCHLTATRQTMMRDATPADYLAQARHVFETYDQTVEQGAPRGEKVHYNFMARGEPLANAALLSEPDSVFAPLADLARLRNLSHEHKVSTILPADFRADLAEVLGDPASSLYLSLYSLDPGFRKRWLPKAMPGEAALDLVADYQKSTGRLVNLHWAFIAGANDAERDIDAIAEAVLSRGLRAKFNLVRYNPHSARHGVEPDEARLAMLFDRLSSALGGTGSRIVPRVGLDVKASCGTFVEDGDLLAA